VLAASRYGGQGFGDLEDLRLTLADRGGEVLLGFSAHGLDAMRAVIFGELYRRDGGWKFRAVGQGYATGLAGLATDFGIDVDDDGEEGEEEATALVADVPPAHTPVPQTAEAPAPEAPAAPKRPRTARKKVTLPAVARKSLAENDSWHLARLFPCGALKSDREREMRATSVLLAVMAQVPEYGRRLTAGFGAPAGRMETYTEVSLPHGETPRRPDGVIRVERAGKLWTALVETKTNGNALRSAQVQDYMDIAARRGYEAVVTISNDVALDGRPAVEVQIEDGQVMRRPSGVRAVRRSALVPGL
jgi:hypothetical protein